MQLYCKTVGGALAVVASHADGDTTPTSAYGDGVIILPYSGDAPLEDLLGKPVPDGLIDLPGLKATLGRQVDARAEDIRLKLITPGSGQAMEYQEAYSQAQAALAATGAVKPADYPMLAATIGVDIDPDTSKPATDVLGVARSVKAAYEAYLQAGAAIRGARLLGKAEIGAAADAVTALTVFAAIKWPSFGA
jgi:hypothetical protein